MRKPSYATKHLVMAPYRHSIIAMRTRQLGARTLTKRHSAASRLAPPMVASTVHCLCVPHARAHVRIPCHVRALTAYVVGFGLRGLLDIDLAIARKWLDHHA